MKKKQVVFAWISFIFSVNTLLCCVLPTLLTIIGLSYFLISLSKIPWLSFSVEYKFWNFFIAGVFILIANWINFRPNQSCHGELNQQAKCEQLSNFSRWLVNISAGIWLISFLVIYLALPIRILLD